MLLAITTKDPSKIWILIGRPGDIWEFKKMVDGTQFYVKVKIVQENGENILKCLGFHKDDFA